MDGCLHRIRICRSCWIYFRQLSVAKNLYIKQTRAVRFCLQNQQRRTLYQTQFQSWSSRTQYGKLLSGIFGHFGFLFWCLKYQISNAAHRHWTKFKYYRVEEKYATNPKSNVFLKAFWFFQKSFAITEWGSENFLLEQIVIKWSIYEKSVLQLIFWISYQILDIIS